MTDKDIYRGFEIAKVDGEWMATDGNDQRMGFKRDSDAMDWVDAIFRARRIDAELRA